MIICNNCSVELKIMRVGVVIEVHKGIHRRGDRYGCPKCKIAVLTQFGKAHSARKYNAIADIVLPA